MIKLLEEHEVPQDFKYPESIYKLIELNLVNFDVWYFMDNKSARCRMKGLQERYSTRKLVPFARRGDCDDVACFEVGRGGEVFVIHDFASTGYEQREHYESVWEWLRSVINDMVEFEILEGII